jgi:hypothetical protein
MRFTAFFLAIAAISAVAVRAQTCDVMKAISAVMDLSECTEKVPKNKSEICACALEGRQAITVAGCASSEFFTLFNLINRHACAADVQCEIEPTLQCVVMELGSFLSNNKTSCDQFSGIESCIRATCPGALPAEVRPYVEASRKFICAERGCDIMRQATCGLSVVQNVESMSSIDHAQIEGACNCAKKVFECATTETPGYKFDKSLLFAIVQQSQAVCSATCQRNAALTCAAQFGQCRANAANAGACNSCTTIAQSCLAATLCTSGDGFDQITKISALQCSLVSNGSKPIASIGQSSDATAIGANIMGVAALAAAAVMAL